MVNYVKPQRGVNFSLLLGDGATPTELFSTVCIGKTMDFDRTLVFDDEMVTDCDNPQSLPVRASVATGQTWDISFSGTTDFKKFQTLEAIFDGLPRNVQVAKAGAGAAGGGVYKGPAILANLKESKTNNGIVNFTASLKGQGVIPSFLANA